MDGQSDFDYIGDIEVWNSAKNARDTIKDKFTVAEGLHEIPKPNLDSPNILPVITKDEEEERKMNEMEFDEI